MRDLLQHMFEEGRLTASELVALKKTAHDLSESPVRLMRSLRIATAQELLDSLVKFTGCAVYDPKIHHLSAENATWFPKELARFLNVLPLAETEHHLELLTEDPTSLKISATLTFLFRKKIKFIVTTAGQLIEGFNKVYGLKAHELNIRSLIDVSRGVIPRGKGDDFYEESEHLSKHINHKTATKSLHKKQPDTSSNEKKSLVKNSHFSTSQNKHKSHKKGADADLAQKPYHAHLESLLDLDTNHTALDQFLSHETTSDQQNNSVDSSELELSKQESSEEWDSSTDHLDLNRLLAAVDNPALSDVDEEISGLMEPDLGIDDQENLSNEEDLRVEDDLQGDNEISATESPFEIENALEDNEASHSEETASADVTLVDQDYEPDVHIEMPPGVIDLDEILKPRFTGPIETYEPRLSLESLLSFKTDTILEKEPEKETAAEQENSKEETNEDETILEMEDFHQITANESEAEIPPELIQQLGSAINSLIIKLATAKTRQQALDLANTKLRDLEVNIFINDAGNLAVKCKDTEFEIDSPQGNSQTKATEKLNPVIKRLSKLAS